jgi:hypothetical protein
MSKPKPTKAKTLRVRLTEHEHAKLEAFAARRDQSVSLIIREYIRRLPTNSESISE